MNRRIRVIMDENRNLLPDGKENYLIGHWDVDMEDAVNHTMSLGRTILVIRPEGFDLTLKSLYGIK